MTTKLCVVLLAVPMILGCSTTKTDSEQVVMYETPVGTKTDLFEVTASNKLALQPGVRVEVVPGPCGPKSGMILFRRNNEIGGYMSCGCHPATSGSCSTVNDNPEHPECSGGCRNSEGVSVGCSMFGPIIGPPRNPLSVALRTLRP